MPKLRVLSPGAEPRVLELEGELVVGRTAPADLEIADAKVSRRHCCVKPSGIGWIVQDLGSSNGTRVNGKAVKTQPLRAGDKIEVGLTVLVYELDPPKAKFKAPSRGSSARERLARRKK